MKEELFVIIENPDKLVGRRRYQKVDLYVPAGITLSFKSELFSDLTKVTCSHSYSFKVPLTNNNRRIFDFAEDVRHESLAIRKRLDCVFIQDGVEIMRNANLYIQSITDCYNVVMTWNVVPGLSRLIDEDCSLRDLCDMGMAAFGTTDYEQQASGFDNTASVAYPLYDAGLPYVSWETKTFGGSDGWRPATTISDRGGFLAPPMPVVPIKFLMSRICERFGFDLSFGIGNELMVKGVVPLVGIDLTQDQLDDRAIDLGNIIFSRCNGSFAPSGAEPLHIPDHIIFDGRYMVNDYLTFGIFKLNPLRDEDGEVIGIKPAYKGMEVEFDGAFSAKFKDFTATRHPGANVEEQEAPTLTVYQLVWNQIKGERGEFSWEERANISGVNSGNNGGYIVYVFDFAVENGKARLSCSGLDNSYPLFFVFSDELEGVSMEVPISIHLKNSTECIAPRNIDVASNLPDIECSTFVKSLFYMSGGYPIVDAEGGIRMRYFTEIKDNLACGNVLDWSDRIYGRKEDLPENITFSTNNFGQKNYYLMKSDSVDDTDSGDETDVYAPGLGIFEVHDKTAELTKTIIQLPFYPPYIKNLKWPKYDTGNTIKAWELDDDTNIYSRFRNDGVKFVEPKPSVGLIEDKELHHINSDGTVEVTGTVMSMRIWNGFHDLLDGGSLAYLAEILSHAFFVTEKMRLSELDLANIDFSVPVYLDRHNSFFALISVTRDSKGLSKCEFIKLP